MQSLRFNSPGEGRKDDATRTTRRAAHNNVADRIDVYMMSPSAPKLAAGFTQRNAGINKNAMKSIYYD